MALPENVAMQQADSTPMQSRFPSGDADNLRHPAALRDQHDSLPAP
jgi:hypothetical protein